jgi:hypothetical protein
VVSPSINNASSVSHRQLFSDCFLSSLLFFIKQVNRVLIQATGYRNLSRQVPVTRLQLHDVAATSPDEATHPQALNRAAQAA